MKRTLLTFGLAALIAAGCTTELSTQEKLETANRYMRENGGDAHYRALAYGLYGDVLEETARKDWLADVHFGLGMIGLLDLAQGVPQLIAGLENDDADASEESTLPPADTLAKTIDTLAHEVLDRGIARHFAEVLKQDDYSFEFTNLVIPVTDPTKPPIDLSGEWDLTEVGLIYGAIEIVMGLEELVFAYDEVVATVIDAALSGKPIPELPESPAEFPAWITQAAKDLGLNPLPWLRPEFGKLSGEADLAAMRARFAAGFGALADAMRYLRDEKNDQDDVFPKKSFATTVIEKLLGELDTTTKIVTTVITTSLLEGLFAELHASVTNDGTVFAGTMELWDVLDMTGSLYDGPSDPVGLRVPAMNLSRLFTNPIADLKDPKAGLLPYFGKDGAFEVHSEQEKWTDTNGNEEVDDGEYKDTGVDGFVAWVSEPTRPGAGDLVWNDPLGLRGTTGITLSPLKHESPLGAIEEANGIVDPVYVFFANPSFNGFLLPMTGVTEGDITTYEAHESGDYTNPDLMRLISSIVWLVDSL